MQTNTIGTKKYARDRFSNGIKTLIGTLSLAFVLALPQVSAAMSYAFPYGMQQAQPIYYEQLSLTGCPYPTSVSAFTGTSASTGVSYDTSDSYRVGVLERTSESYLVGTSYQTGASYRTGYSPPTDESAVPVGTPYSAGRSAGPASGSGFTRSKEVQC